MSEVIITAAAWIPDEPKIELSQEDVAEFTWRILAEASVTDTDGKPISKLTKSSWNVHVTDASGTTWAPPFSVAPVNALFLSPPGPPGFYLLKVDQFPTAPGVAPTAFGIVIAYKKLNLEGQVVVPVALAGPTVVSTLTTPGF
jgi:hypothetical protein